jgi:peptide-methionine (S)-S-oxide reductase
VRCLSSSTRRSVRVAFGVLRRFFASSPASLLPALDIWAAQRTTPHTDVCTDTTGHVEVVEVSYDPSRISYDDLLDVFWQLHDPTSMDDQGPYEQGSQYRGVVFSHDANQEAAARASKAALKRRGVYHEPIVTEIRPATRFWPAEDHHQRYIQKGGTHHCNVFNRAVTFPAEGKAERSAQDG